MFKKKTLICSLILLFALTLPIHAQKPIKLWINGHYVKTDVDPVVENQRTLVPIRVISENLGIEVEWKQESQSVMTYQMTPSGPDFSNSLLLTLGDKRVAKPAEEAAKTGELYYHLDVAPKAINNRTMVPIRFIAEAYKIKVDWDQENQTVVIGENYKGPAASKKPAKNKPGPAKTQGQEKGPGLLPGDVDLAKARYIGNGNTAKFHFPSCKAAKKIQPHNKRGLSSKEKALQLGYKACGICKP